MLVTGSSFRNSYMKSEIQQAQLTGNLEFVERLAPGFRRGADRSEESLGILERAGGHLGWRDQRGRLSGQRVARRHRAPLLRQHLRQRQLRRCSTSSSRSTSRRCAASPRMPSNNDAHVSRLADHSPTDRRVEEESKSAFVQYSTEWEMGPADARRSRLALREDGCGHHARWCRRRPGIVWVANNEFSLHARATESLRDN